MVEVQWFLECFSVKDVSDVEVCTFVDGEVEEVDSFRGVLMCEVQVGVKGVEFCKEGSQFLCCVRPDHKDVVYVTC